MSIEVDDAEPSRGNRTRDGRGGWERDRVVAAEHDRDRAAARHLEHLALDDGVGALNIHRHHRCVAGVYDVKPRVRLDVELQ
jgi:hypothetical protein